MQRSKNVRTKDRGFTLLEMLVTIIVAGVLAAIAAPSLVGLLNRNQVNEAQRQVASALKEAQRQAIRRGKSCTVNIKTNDNTISSPDNGCLLSQRDVDENTLVGGDQVSLSINGTSPLTISFTNKGAFSNAGNDEVILIESTLSSARKCVVILDGLGSIITGIYSETETKIDPEFCNPVN